MLCMGNYEENIQRIISNGNINDYISCYYKCQFIGWYTFFDREADAGGKQYWINKLNSGMSRQQVQEGFSRSEEFSKIMKRYGL